jgi:hypothetical protein
VGKEKGWKIGGQRDDAFPVSFSSKLSACQSQTVGYCVVSNHSTENDEIYYDCK